MFFKKCWSFNRWPNRVGFQAESLIEGGCILDTSPKAAHWEGAGIGDVLRMHPPSIRDSA